MPKISVVMPLYHGIKYLTESLQSIQQQTLKDWEFLIVSEPDQNDGSTELVRSYAKNDTRIRLIVNDERIGLAASLNRGIKEATGTYIARVDVDDPSYPERFAKQAAFLDENPDVFLCGALARSVLPDDEYILEVPCEREELKASMLFGCDISHCSVMFRRQEWIESGYEYDADSLCEDYALWTKIMFEKTLVNLPEPLVDHRWGFENISLQKGKRLQDATCRVTAEVWKRFGVELDEDKLVLASAWRSKPEEYARRNKSAFLRESFGILTALREGNRARGWIDPVAMDRVLWKRWDWVCDCCGIFHPKTAYDDAVHPEESPVVSVIMPVFGAVRTIRETIDSIRVQDFAQFEFLILCEAGNTDGSTELAKFYALFDRRIRVVENDRMLGLAATLNKGIGMARGRYIARIDADDLSNRLRLSAQVAYMDAHSDIGFTQFYQHYFGPGANGYIHRPAVTAEELEARFLFFCDATHSTVMLRRDVLEKSGMYYDEASAIEDFELWTRLIRVTGFATIPEVCGEYRVGMANVSREKEERIQRDMCAITARQLRENLGLSVPEERQYLLGSYLNPVGTLTGEKKAEELAALKQLLLSIREANLNARYYRDDLLVDTLTRKWRWAESGRFWSEPVADEETKSFLGVSKHSSNRLKKVLIRPLKWIQELNLHLHAKSIEHLSSVTADVAANQANRLDHSTEEWTWERHQRLASRLDRLEEDNRWLHYQLLERSGDRYVPFLPGEKIRLVFLFQAASFWPSWESFYRACMDDDRFDVRLLLLDESGTEASQMKTAEAFLESARLDYCRFEDFDLDAFRPHAIVLQTPYDRWHRSPAHRSGVFRAQGYRLVYIPYGIEISDTEESRRLHFEEDVLLNAWRIFTLSDSMRREYFRYCANRKAVCSVGLPRFDYYAAGEEQLAMMPEGSALRDRAKGRRIVLWKVHFPKKMMIGGTMVAVTPDYTEYLRFAKRLHEYENFYFVFLPHPKFFETKLWGEESSLRDEIMAALSAQDNAYVEYADDYRAAVAAADYIIVDRSAVMVEAGARGVPVLYMHNPHHDEKMTEAIRPLIGSYYQGTNAEDMFRFLDMCIENRDPLRYLRRKAFVDCVPGFDGEAGKRIKDEIYKAISEEDRPAVE